MSDTQRTPRGTARVNSEECETELAAVWFAANFYYESSVRRRKEYIGVVFRKPNGKFGITVRGDGTFAGCKVSVFDVPDGTIPVAVWHTHLPMTLLGKTIIAKLLGEAFEEFSELVGASFEDFSDRDKKLARDNTRRSVLSGGGVIRIYLATDTLIKRFTPGSEHPEKIWHKQPPGRMQRQRLERHKY
jgi:hypothetical protein